MEKRILPNKTLLSSAGELLAEGRDVTLMVKGNSMLPFLHSEKDSVILHKMDSVAVGDMILARIAPEHYVLHRVWSVENGKITLMGDGNLRGTEHCTPDNVLGTVTKILYGNGKTAVPGKGKLWRRLLPVRRYLLAIYRRII